MTIREEFYVMNYTLSGEYVETQWFGASKHDATLTAGRSSRLPMVSEVFSTVEHGPIETWVAGSFYGNHSFALDRAADLALAV